MTAVRRDKRADGRGDSRRTDGCMDFKPSRAERFLIRLGFLLMVVFAVYAALNMGWIRNSLFE